MTSTLQADIHWMEYAIELSRNGVGKVEPNPMVGCVLVKNGRLIGEGFHQKFGGPHAEVHAIESTKGSTKESAKESAKESTKESTIGATAYVTLEPCSHFGKTPPCADALIEAGIQRVVIGHLDPNPLVAGAGAQKLRDAGIDVEVGLLHEKAARVLGPFVKRMTHNLPWIIAKWAMTLDGKIGTSTGDSMWISNEYSRQIVHQIRGRVDGIMVGANTVLVDDPMLTARPAGCRVATRIVVDSLARTPSSSKLCQTARLFPTLIGVGPEAPQVDVDRLIDLGCSVWRSSVPLRDNGLMELLTELAVRGMTNVLVEGGGTLLGSLHDIRQIDECHVFIAPKIVGGENARIPVLGTGALTVNECTNLNVESVRQLGNDIYIMGRPTQ